MLYILKWVGKHLRKFKYCYSEYSGAKSETGLAVGTSSPTALVLPPIKTP